jgi:uncharacterized protein (DUF1015 family)
MVDVAPFRALRYDPTVAGDPAATSAPAYSELERFRYASHRTASPYTILELITPRPGVVFSAASSTYKRWRRTGVLVEEPELAFYRYEQHELRHGAPAVQRGVLAAVALEPPGGSVLDHEEVEPARVAERLGRLRAVPADISPVLALYSGGSDALRALLTAPPSTPPMLAFSDEAGIDHRVWCLDDDADIETVRSGLEDARVVIADGHHRYASALAYRDERGDDAEAPWQRTLMYLVDQTHGGTEVKPIHRLVRSWQPGAPGKLSREFVIEEVDDALDAMRRHPVSGNGILLGLRLPGGVGLLLRPKSPDALLARLPAGHSDAWCALDTAVVDHAVLPALGAAGIEGRSDAPAATAEVDAGAAVALFLVRPADLGTVVRLADKGERMPARTTWFRPKPRAGLVMRSLEPAFRLPRGPGEPTVGA